MSRFPNEAPIFEVKRGGSFARKGALVEAFEVPGPFGGSVSGAAYRMPEGWLGVRILTRVNHDGPVCSLHPDGWFGMSVGFEDLRPLTATARDMLRHVRADWLVRHG